MPPQDGVLTPALHLCGCCRNVVLCCACATDGFRDAAPTLSEVNDERLGAYMAPLCGDCFGNDCKQTQLYAANEATLDREITAAAKQHVACLSRRDELVQRGYVASGADGGAGGALHPQTDGDTPPSHNGPERADAPPPRPRDAALAVGTLAWLPSRKPPVLCIVVSAGAQQARVGLTRATDSFTCEHERFAGQEDRELSDVVPLSHLKLTVGSGTHQLYGLSTFSAFRVRGYPFGILQAGFDVPLRWGDGCTMNDGWRVGRLGSDTEFTFSGAVKTDTGAWSVVLLFGHAMEEGGVEPALIVLPIGAVSRLRAAAPEAVLDHMHTLQQVRAVRPQPALSTLA